MNIFDHKLLREKTKMNAWEWAELVICNVDIIIACVCWDWSKKINGSFQRYEVNKDEDIDYRGNL